MFKNYFKIAWRNIIKNTASSFINIGGLAAGMVVAMLIGLWIYDELSYDKYHRHYDRIAKIREHVNVNGDIQTGKTVPYALAGELRTHYGSYFKHIVMSSHRGGHILSNGEKTLTRHGVYLEHAAPDMLTLHMLKGGRNGLHDPSAILLSESTAKAFFGDADPMDKIMKIDNKLHVKVTGVYEDLPANSTFASVTFIAPFQLYVSNSKWISNTQNSWSHSYVQAYVQIPDDADMDQVSALIKNIRLGKIKKEDAMYKPTFFLEPMSKWHLYATFTNGVQVGGRIQYVWMFGIIGVFVLLLACINFMNLSTARSEKRAKEVGIRKAIGSLRGQLVSQFFCESLLVVFLAFVFSLLLVQLLLPFFNELADKKMSVLWRSPLFWLMSIGFSLVTGIIAGSYPAFYLSSFQPVKVLKGTFRVGRFAALPRKLLVVVQFTVSVTLIICTVIVFRQVQFAKDRPLGYNCDGLIIVPLVTRDIPDHFETVREELIKSRAIIAMAGSESTTTDIWGTDGGFEWPGKDPNLTVDFPNTGISFDYGKTVGWQFVAGRDFSRRYPTDSSGFILNEAAVQFMSLKEPVGAIITLNGTPFTVIGVIKDAIVESPYERVRPAVFCLARGHDNFALLKMNPAISASKAITSVEAVFKKYNPAAPFDYKFVDEEYAKKFGNEERIGKLAGVFAVLAVLISCLGLFGLASFVAEQRTREIGVRKVLGASVFDLWQLLSKDFVALVIISCFIAIPIAWYFLYQWLQQYSYRTNISGWVFAAAGAGAMLISVLTVSYQSIKAAMVNPVKSLKSE